MATNNRFLKTTTSEHTGTPQYPSLLTKTLPAVWIGLILLCPALLIEIANSFDLVDLRFHRDLIAQGEWWRLLTGHLDHTGFVHLALNALFLVLLLAIFSALQATRKTLVYWLCCSLMISILMLLFSPDLTWYVGLSGSLYSLLIIGITFEKRYSRLIRAIAVLAVGLKVLLEQNTTNNPISELISAPVSEVSHLYGLIAGLTLCAIIYCYSRFSNHK